MERYLMYLRKSRMDTDYEEISITETLSRHRITLEKLCKSKRLHVDEVLEEVVSGESLAARPQMMRLLEMVSTGDYAGVVCMDIERLSRGSSMESGYIMQILQVNGCKIVTPGKTYDLQNESDEQFTDMKFMFSRYELKTITKRLVRGRNQSASEGKFMGSMAPYGYQAYKLPGEKGNSLMIVPEEAEIVRLIFDMYGKQLNVTKLKHEMNNLMVIYGLSDMVCRGITLVKYYAPDGVMLSEIIHSCFCSHYNKTDVEVQQELGIGRTSFYKMKKQALRYLGFYFYEIVVPQAKNKRFKPSLGVEEE